MDATIKLKKKRKGINEEIAALLSEVEGLGVSKPGFKAALKRYELSEEEREDMDFSFALCCKAVGVTFQEDLFEKKDPPTTH